MAALRICGFHGKVIGVMNDQPKGIAEILKEQFALLAILVLLAGTVYADGYYGSFGLKLSSLGFSSSYVIYRGFTVILDCIWVGTPYLLSAIWFAVDEILLRPRNNLKAFRVMVVYFVVLLVLVSTYLLAHLAGVERANKDMHQETSTLTRIKTSKPSIDGCGPDACRILFTDSDTIYILLPSPSSQTGTVPNVRWLQRKDYSEVITGTQ